jgi:acid stress chaperone HdeA
VTVVAVVACGVWLTGCAEVEQALNRGGDTTCGDYLKQDEHEQRVTVTKFVKERSGRDDDPSGTVVDATMVATRLLCQIPANADQPIRNANVANIFAPPPAPGN